MGLILAIEPNRNQSQQIAQMVKHHLRGVELITAGSADAALMALGDRIPDLILTPALLASKDEAALTDRLRHLGPKAAHIHTLAVPIIDSSKPRNRDHGGGLLGRRKDKSAPSDSVGCDPAVFAEQIKVYLDRASHERVAAAETLDSEVPMPAPSETTVEDELDGIDWLIDERTPAEETKAAPSRESTIVPKPTGGVPLAPNTLTQTAVHTPSPATSEPPRTHATPATRAFEAEFGLPSAISTSPPLWRVTEEGIESMSAEAPVLVGEPQTFLAGPVVEQAPFVRTAGKPPKPAKTKKAQPPPDDWALFDPQQSAFKALLKRLDEVAGFRASAPMT